jgi:hypothetical protein
MITIIVQDKNRRIPACVIQSGNLFLPTNIADNYTLK